METTVVADVVGCMASAGQNCTHNVDKCVNCNGRHIVQANCCEKKQEVIKKPREERGIWKERKGERKNITMNQQTKLDITADGVPCTEDAENNGQHDE
jgi:hypothetical protein